MSQAISKFVADVALHFPNRFDSEASEDEWLQSMFRNLRGYNSDVLNRAAQRIVDTRTDRRFPLPSECKKVCDDISTRDRAESGAKLEFDVTKTSPYSDWRIKLADDLIACPLGKDAASEGWILSLHDFARMQGRLPIGSEITKCKAGAKGFDEAYALCVRGEAGACGRSLRDLGDSMLKRREDLRSKALGKMA